MGLKGPTRPQIVTAVTFALSVFLIALFAWLSFGGSTPLQPTSYRFNVTFGPEAINLVPTAQARISGVPVGKVVKVDRTTRGVKATIEIDAKYAPLPANVRAIVRSKTLLGENFVQLSQGDPRGPKLPDGASLPATATPRTEQIDNVLSMFDARTRRSLRTFVTGAGSALDGREEALNNSLGHVGPTVDSLYELADILDTHDAGVQSLVSDTGTTLQAISSRDQALQQLIKSGDTVFAATARRDRSLSATVEALPPFVADLHSTLREVNRTIDDAAPAVRGLRKATPDLRPALKAGGVLGPELQGLFRRLNPAVPELRRALPALTEILRATRPSLSAIDGAVRQLVPIVRYAEPYRSDLVSALANVGAVTNGTAGLKSPNGRTIRHLRVVPTIINEQLNTYRHKLPSNRRNTYPQPRAQDVLGKAALRSFDCRHASNPQIAPVLGSTPPCLEQGPFSFNGQQEAYPRVKPYRP